MTKLSDDDIRDCFIDLSLSAQIDVSVIVCCKNRQQNLFKALKSWLILPEIKEIIILDYGSDNPIDMPLSDHKIKLFRYDAKYWHLAKAYNMAMQLATKNILLKLDCDYFLQNNFFHINPLGANEFMIGPGGPTMGMLMIHKDHFYQVNGYNENIINYGGDDNDMYYRLNKLGLKRIVAKKRTISHLPHPNILRTQYQPDPSLSKSQSTNMNKRLAKYNPWTTNDVMSKLWTK